MRKRAIGDSVDDAKLRELVKEEVYKNGNDVMKRCGAGH